MQGEILDHQEEGLPKDLHEGGGQEVDTSRYGASEDVESACSGFGPYRKIEVEETDGSCCGQKELNLSVLRSWRPLVLRWRKISLLWPPSIGQKEPGLENGIMNKKKLG